MLFSTDRGNTIVKIGAVFLGLLMIVLAGCDDDQIRTYDVSKAEKTETANPASDSSQSISPGSSDAMVGAIAAPAWVVPAHWQQVKEPRAMRFATFTAEIQGKSVEVIVSRFPGDVGGLLANVNRWRQQVGMEPTDQVHLQSDLKPFTTHTMTGYTLRLPGPKLHMVAAIIQEPSAGQSWFVKATATPDVIDLHQADVVRFAESFGQVAETQPMK